MNIHQIEFPNPTTRAAMQEVEEKKHLKKTSLEQLKKDWDEACKK